MKPNIFFSILLVFLILISPFIVSANADDAIQIPQALHPCLEKMLELTSKACHQAPDETTIGQIIDYLQSSKNMSATYSAGKRKGATSSYYEFTINRSMKELINLAYNPAIPSYFIIPASLRQSRWIEVNGEPTALPDLTQALDDLSEPILYKGVEFVENTPDTFSGAYYAYELNRAVVLTAYQGHPALFSMSSQKGKSEVGKKGLVVGSDDDWNYLYTGEKGCTRRGFGWVDSYMYNSDSIMVYYEVTDPTPHVHCAVFKWVDAGWAGINMAKPIHIKKGIERFVKTYKQIIEFKGMPDPAEVAATIGQINSLPTRELREKARDHFEQLKKHHGNDNYLTRKWFPQLFKDDNHYVEQMNPEELKVVICKEYLKYLLGKSHGFDIAMFEKNKDRPKRPG